MTRLKHAEVSKYINNYCKTLSLIEFEPTPNCCTRTRSPVFGLPWPLTFQPQNHVNSVLSLNTLGSFVSSFLEFCHYKTFFFNRKRQAKVGPVRDLNPGPLTPKARIMPLDQRATDVLTLLANIKQWELASTVRVYRRRYWFSHITTVTYRLWLQTTSRCWCGFVCYLMMISGYQCYFLFGSSEQATDLGRESACRLISSTSTISNLILIL